VRWVSSGEGEAVRRRFNSGERAALFIAADGRCEECNVELQPGWHADHDVPFSRGGATDVVNGRALCPHCNLKKGAGVKLRTWQQEFLTQADLDDFLLVACPGAGKTTAALHALRRWWSQGSRVVVVVPTENLKKQWKRAAKGILGIEVSDLFKNSHGRMPRDMEGIAVTYAQVASAPLLFRRLVSEKRTMVILDEVHHCGDQQSWGSAVKSAFEPAARRLCLSGTPFRGDNSRIPFVRYEPADGGEPRSIADYSYGYAEALRDGVCREIFFPNFEGEMEWMSRGDILRKNFRDDIPDDERARRLRTALDARSEWVREVLGQAHVELRAIREEDTQAGGLILAIDTAHAEALADVMADVAGVRPIVVTSEYEDSSDRIDDFRDSRDEWIVAVRQVSEGVDIPRLKCLVYATNVKAELFFRQAVGRISRGADMAHCFLPADPDLVTLAEKIQEERHHALREVVEDVKREASSSSASQASFFVPLGATSADLAGGHLNGDEFTRGELDRAEKVRESTGSKVPVIEIARLLRAAGVSSAEKPESPSGDHDDREQLKAKLAKLVRRWAMKESRGGKPDFRAHQRRANTEPHERYVGINEATIAELKTAIAWVAQRI
jgi:superfamily II DNA or RNA helicase